MSIQAVSDFLVICFRNMGIFALMEFTMNKAIFQPLAIKYSNPKDKHRFITSSWKCFIYVLFVAFGIFTVKDEFSWLWNVFDYVKPYSPDGQIPWKIDYWYKMETSFYLYSTISIFFEPKMKDRTIMLFHHLFTFTLLILSYFDGYTKFGVAIMLLHDLSDPFMEAAKMFNYCGVKKVADVFLALFAIFFTITRLWVYPKHLVYPIVVFKEDDGLCLKIITGALIALQVMHIFWMYQILKVLTRAVVYGKLKDVREDD